MIRGRRPQLQVTVSLNQKAQLQGLFPLVKWHWGILAHRGASLPVEEIGNEIC